MLRDAASGRDLTGWVDLYGAHRGRSIRGYPSAGAGVGGVARPGGVARVRGATAGGQCGVPACPAVPGPGPRAARPRARRGAARAHQGATDRHTAQPEAEPRPRVRPNVPARARVGTAAYPPRARARAPDRPSARVRTLSALKYRRRRCSRPSAQRAPRAHCRIASCIRIYTHASLLPVTRPVR